jgi:hypothetical protein
MYIAQRVGRHLVVIGRQARADRYVDAAAVELDADVRDDARRALRIVPPCSSARGYLARREGEKGGSLFAR